MTVLYACASHLLVDLPLFAGPALMVIGAIVLITRAERKRARVSSASPTTSTTSAAISGRRPRRGGDVAHPPRTR